MRTFHAGRISELVELPESFVPQPDFDAATWFANSFRAERGATSHDIAVRFDPAQAIYIRERRWHADQAIEELPDGGLILRWHGSGLGEIKRWVLQYGAQAEVLSPNELREAVAGEVKGLARRYGG
jgi:predicted DNA-binding transcriptional regulator YafY